MAWENVVEGLRKDLNSVFRYVFPGAIVLAGGYLSHPDWFRKVDLAKGGHLAAMAAIALVLGNAWYVLQRYTLHHFIDWVLYLSRGGYGAPFRGYLDWLSAHITKGDDALREKPEVKRHILVRSAQVIFMFCIGEVMFVFSLWPEKGTCFHAYKWSFRIGGLALFFVCVVQYFIANGLDWRTAGRTDAAKKKANDEGACS